LENLVQDLNMFCHVFGKDEDVVHIYGYFPGCDEFSEDHVHHGLEVGKAEEHHRGFVRTQWSNESCLPLVSFFDPYIVVSPSYVQFAENGGPFYHIQQFLD
ncbi:hypothetical protein HETIRDRAFT_318867, partial [Heterobasidion irregulare TC 32-1]